MKKSVEKIKPKTVSVSSLKLPVKNIKTADAATSNQINA